MTEIFQRYEGIDPIKDPPVAAVQVQAGEIRKLSQITGGTAMSKTVRGGSTVFHEIVLHGQKARVGDYIIADRYNTYRAFPKDFFETRYKLKGPLPSSERR